MYQIKTEIHAVEAASMVADMMNVLKSDPCCCSESNKIQHIVPINTALTPLNKAPINLRISNDCLLCDCIN